MTIDTIVNKADFQRHLNGCERRLNDLTKLIQTIEKSSQKLLLNHNQQEKDIYLIQFNEILSQIKFLNLSIKNLEQSSFALYSQKRLDLLKENFEKIQNKFQQYSQINIDYDNKQINNEYQQQAQLIKLINSNNDETELDLINERITKINNLEDDINEIQRTFIDVHRIIHEQGTTITSIEQSLTNADEMVYEATENVQTTLQVKKRSKRIKWILIFSLIFVIIITIIIVYFTLKLALPVR